VVPSVWNALSARAAVTEGAQVLFLSGSALAASLGLPDIGAIRPDELVRAADRIVQATGRPLIVDGETGFGSLAALSGLVRDLKAVGVAGIHIEDQEYTGQSVSARSGLCSPETMLARVNVAKNAGGTDVKVLARTDVIGADWPREHTLERLSAYRDAGADWTMAVFVRSYEELVATADVNVDGALAIAVPGATGYVPTARESFAAGCRGILVTGLSAAVFAELKKLYRLALDDAVDEMGARRVPATQFADEMDFARHLGWQALQYQKPALPGTG
jgi:methylisocitrate lyase